MVRVDVEPATFDAASKVFGQTIADALSSSFSALSHGLSSCGGMAGTDPGGTQWGNTYDNAVVEITGVTQDVRNGLSRLAGLLEITGFNHGQANSASTPGGTVPTTDTLRYDHEISLTPPPSASGGSGSAPDGWGLISGLVGYVWPDGDQGTLRAAASAWSTAARSVAVAGEEVPAAVAKISMQTSPEVADATQACTAMGTHLSELSAAYASMSTACDDYAHHLDDAHSQVIDELVSLLEWTAGLEIAGGVFAFFTAGISEVVANTALAARVAAVAARVASILSRLIELAGEIAQAITRALAKVIEINQKLTTLLGATISRATATVLGRLRGVSKTAEDLTIGGLKAEARNLGAYSRNDLDTVSQHLARLDHSPANDAMISRIGRALDEGKPLTEGERNFMAHETTEAPLMDQGMSYEEAHDIAGHTHPLFKNYDPEVIDQFPESFNNNWRRAWGMEPR